MALVIIGALLTASFSLVQALYILRSGSLHPFFLKPGVTSQSAAKPTKVGRLRYALIYLIPGLAIVAILTVLVIEGRQVFRFAVDGCAPERLGIWLRNNWLWIRLFVASGDSNQVGKECLSRA